MSDHHALVTVSQARDLLGVGKTTLERAIKRGEYTVIWADGEHGRQRLLPRWQIDKLPEPPGWSPDDYAEAPMPRVPTSAPAIPEPPPAPVLDLAPMIASHDRLVSDLRELERTIGRQDAELASLRAENAQLKESIAHRANTPQRPAWRFWERS